MMRYFQFLVDMNTICCEGRNKRYYLFYKPTYQLMLSVQGPLHEQSYRNEKIDPFLAILFINKFENRASMWMTILRHFFNALKNYLNSLIKFTSNRYLTYSII